ncbi:MAG: hypothetical protein IKB97_03335 [Bacteroidaceae bacterium]|nr:hypothetical protein [Bacteroidaceae bacterium]
MLNLFKHQWLPDYIREYILKKFPTKHFKVTFEINGKDIPMDQVVGDERNIKKGTVTYTDAEGNSTMNWLFLYKGEISFDSVDHAVDNFTLEGIEPGVRKLPRVGKKEVVEKYRKTLKKKLSDAMDYCPGSFLDKLHEYPITDMPRWRRKRILNLLANMSEDGILAFVSFDLDNASLSQLEQFNEELELAMMVENKYEPELDTEG